jgi:hypothetical protein
MLPRDEQRYVVIVFGLAVFWIFEARVPEAAYTLPLAPAAVEVYCTQHQFLQQYHISDVNPITKYWWFSPINFEKLPRA